MNKLVKVITFILIVAIVATLSIALVACDKDKYEEISLSKEEAVQLIAKIAEDTANLKDFEIKIDEPDTKIDFTVIAVDNKSALLGTMDGVEIFVGKFRQGEGYELNAGFYEKVDGEWEDATYEFEGETATINELRCYEVIDILERVEFFADDAEISGSKSLKNGNIESYSIKVTYDGDVVELKTMAYDGKQVVASATFVSEGVTTTYAYTYGVTFEIPER